MMTVLLSHLNDLTVIQSLFVESLLSSSAGRVRAAGDYCFSCNLNFDGDTDAEI